MPKPFDETAKRRFVELSKRGRPPALAAEDIGFTWATIRKHLGTDPDFAAEVEQAVMVVDSRVQETAYDLAVSGDHPASTWKWLEARRRSEFGTTTNVQHTITGPGGGPVQLAAVTVEAFRGVLIDPETRQAALAMASEVPIIEVQGTET